MPPQRVRSRQGAVKWIAATLAIAVHVGFVLFLIFSVSWQSWNPEPVTVELYAPAAPAQVEPAKPPPEPPKPEPPKPEPPKPQVEPPKPPPQAEPRPPDIALKEKQERMKKEQERERKDKERQEAEKKQQEKRLADARERQAREAQAMQAQAEREVQAQQKAIADAKRAKAQADYIRRIQAKIRGNVVVPPDMQGDPEAVFDVVQLPTGEIIDAQLSKSSGVRAYDEAVQRAIIKSSPLPLPDTPDMFRRTLTLKFRPRD